MIRVLQGDDVQEYNIKRYPCQGNDSTVVIVDVEDKYQLFHGGIREVTRYLRDMGVEFRRIRVAKFTT